MSGSRRIPVWQCVCATVLGLAVPALWLTPTVAQQTLEEPRGLVSLAGLATSDVQEAAVRVDRMRRSGELRLRVRRQDPVVSGRTHERFDQYYRGVRVFGADVAEQLNGGQVVSVFGTLYDDIDTDTTTVLDADRAREIVEERAGVEIGREPELVILPHGRQFVLTWRVRAATLVDVREYFVDARTGAVVLDYSDLHAQSAVGRGTGVLGDNKKVSASPVGSQFTASDELRPPAIDTYDMKGDFNRTLRYLNGLIQLTANDLATSPNNTWSDGAVVDAHVYSGWTYDYYFKQHNRRGLDNSNRSMISLVHPVRRQDFAQNFPIVPDFYLNAFYSGDGVMVYGEGLPAGSTVGGQSFDFWSGALDVVAHELTHGVTDYTSRLIYQNESGALNEAFSDIMGTSVEFYFQQPGSGSMRADYLMAEDTIRPGGIRSLADPGAYGDPDNYSRRLIVPLNNDNGGVHSNSGIANQAFFLAIEGGTNRTSGLSVQGVGAASRAQIERVFYRAFAELLTSSSNFAAARSATIQAARDLFGNNSAAERAVTQAWTAVGVN